MRIATWNVNSLKARQPRVEEWLEYAHPDVLCLQETKLADDAFPAMAFSALGYDAAYYGHSQWNGVAILSRVGIDDVTTGFDAEVVDPYEGDARLLAATCGGVRVVSTYVPNGREVGTEFYDRKLVWLERLHDWLDGERVVVSRPRHPRRLQRRARGSRRVVAQGVHRSDPRHRARARSRPPAG